MAPRSRFCVAESAPLLKMSATNEGFNADEGNEARQVTWDEENEEQAR